ncbi:hypothetical protein CYMTET_54948 [Cymbomonas tetramitiformis]|uniref:JmjC domain-containing protein n=1 Tax=Cymbomonas tetramitiformis TaxID=36881 RepID=A0AAE0BF32_9CHLO|nr:hypothetical protein CYMTET_54948 [Cymbomonas tetramitiformis]
MKRRLPPAYQGPLQPRQPGFGEPEVALSELSPNRVGYQLMEKIENRLQLLLLLNFICVAVVLFSLLRPVLVESGILGRSRLTNYLAKHQLDCPAKVDSIEATALNTTFFYSVQSDSCPLHIKGLAKQWPAYAKWTDEFFRECCSDAPVKVEHGRATRFANFLPEFSKKKMKFTAFLDEYTSKARIGTMYMPEHKLPAGLDKGDVPQPSFTSYMSPQSVKIWLGAGEYCSLPHTDYQENILVQLEGVKMVRMVEPTQRAWLYPGGRDTKASVHVPPHYSPVDFHEPDYFKFPLVKNVHFHDVNLEAGDALYIPSFWFHSIKSRPSMIHHDMGRRKSKVHMVNTTESNDMPHSKPNSVRNLAVNWWFPAPHAILDKIFEGLEDKKI